MPLQLVICSAIGAGGRGVKASLAAFGAAFDRARGTAASGAKGAEPADCRTGSGAAAKVSGPQSLLKGWQALAARVDALPEPRLRDMARRGLKKVVDYQDIAYGGEYLDRLDRPSRWTVPDHGYALSIAAAKHLANAMCYDDMIRVADLKTRSTRDGRGCAARSASRTTTVLQVTEYFHPRIEEFCGTMPAGLGSYIEARPKLAAFLDRRINRGRRIRTDSFAGFAALWFIGGLRRWRRRLLRHQVEVAHLERWYRAGARPCRGGLRARRRDPQLPPADQGLQRHPCPRANRNSTGCCRRCDLVKGRADAADWIRRLREAALKDEKGDMLDGALKTVASLQ